MGDGYVTRSSSSSTIWRTAENSMFSSPYWERDNDDEEALKWAAIERLPSYDRARQGILNLSDAELKEVDIRNLGFQEKRTLIERLVRDSEEGNQRFLRDLRERIDRVGISLPTIEVRYEHLNIEAEAYVGSRGLPSFFNVILNTVEVFANYLRVIPSKKRPFSILHDVSGIINPCRMTLLLGPPGSGKTSLLLALAGKLTSDLKVSGEVTYNGHKMEEFVPQRTAAYISQHDLHMGEMTVRETLNFSARCQGVGTRYDMLMELLRREKAENIKPDPDIDFFMKTIALEGKKTGVITDYIMKILGLDICADILVGDEMLRGISGGQKKRVTTGEMIVGPAQAFFMDEISTGLDCSTTVQIVNSLRQIIHIFGGTAVLALLQPAPEIYELFDDVILLSDGLIVYQGPRQHVLEFFEFMGFKCPERKSVADYLQEVISRKDQEKYWIRLNKPYSHVSVKEFAKAFRSFHVGERMEKELYIPFDRRKNHPAALTTKKYGVNRIELFKACAERELLLMKRNSFVYAFRAVKMLVMAFITMTLFMRTTMHHRSIKDGWVFLGSLYYSIMIIMFNGFSELIFTIIKLPVFFKQRDYLFYPSWAYAIPTWILKFPFSIIEVSIWVFLNYYVIGYDPNLARFFKHFFLLLLLNQMASGLFRFIAVIGRNMVIASALASFVLLFFLLFGGFIISYGHLKKYLIYGYWISPLMYAQNGISVNEFLGKCWSQIIPGSTEALGISILKSREMFSEARWYWIGVAALLGYILLFNFLFTVSLSYFKPFGKGQPAISEELFKEKQINITEDHHYSHGEEAKKITVYGSEADNLLENKGMVLPFFPLSMTFENIRYSVDMPQEMKAQGVEDRLVLLKDLSGCFRPGVLTALMGVSGAGKTTLMDVLAGRKTGGYIEGNITISGYPKSQKTFARVSGYCEQNDIHSPYVTIYESLIFSAWLRLPHEIGHTKRKIFIGEVMELVELTQLRDALVGLSGLNGLSCEQRKRLTIAVELVANPSIIFMDEPTSGLDARAAAIVIRVVRKMVGKGRTVVCTIHQPSIDIFDAFDELFLMKRGGEEIYVGPLGYHSSQLIKYFEGISGVPMINAGHNPAAWMLEVTTPAYEQLLGIDFSDVYKNSKMYQRNIALIGELSRPHSGSRDLYFRTKYSQSFPIQCIACLWKQSLSYWRNSSYTVVRFFVTLILSLLFGIIFWDIGGKREKQQDLFNAMGSMYGAVLFIGISYGSAVQPIVAIERTVFYRERAAGMYSSLPYAVGQVVIEQPYILVQSLLYCIIVYSMIGFEWTTNKFLWYFFFTYFTLLYFTYYGMLTVGLTPNANIAAVIISAFYGIWNLFSGFVIPRTEMPFWWRWCYWSSPISWTLYGLFVSQYGDVHNMLETKESVADFLRSYFGFNKENLGVVAFMVLFFAIFFASLYAVAIKFINYQKR